MKNSEKNLELIKEQRKKGSKNEERGGARGVMVIVAGCGHDNTSSEPGRAWLHFT